MFGYWILLIHPTLTVPGRGGGVPGRCVGVRHDGQELERDHALRRITAHIQDKQVVRAPPRSLGADEGAGAAGTGGCRDSAGGGGIRTAEERDLTDGVIESNNLALIGHRRKALSSPFSGGHFIGE